MPDKTTDCAQTDLFTRACLYQRGRSGPYESITFAAFGDCIEALQNSRP